MDGMIEGQQSQQSEICYCTALRRASRLLTEHYETIMAPSGLKVTQFALLRVLYRLGGLTISELSEKMDLDRTTLIRNLKLLEDKKWVNIGEKKLSRAYIIELSDEGRVVYDNALTYWEQSQAFLENHLPADRLGEFLSIIKDLISMGGNDIK